MNTLKQYTETPEFIQNVQFLARFSDLGDVGIFLATGRSNGILSGQEEKMFRRNHNKLTLYYPQQFSQAQTTLSFYEKPVKDVEHTVVKHKELTAGEQTNESLLNKLGINIPNVGSKKSNK